eukprot:918009-Prorocentrum_minimum.AAC.1
MRRRAKAQGANSQPQGANLQLLGARSATPGPRKSLRATRRPSPSTNDSRFIESRENILFAPPRAPRCRVLINSIRRFIDSRENIHFSMERMFSLPSRDCSALPAYSPSSHAIGPHDRHILPPLTRLVRRRTLMVDSAFCMPRTPRATAAWRTPGASSGGLRGNVNKTTSVRARWPALGSFRGKMKTLKT